MRSQKKWMMVLTCILAVALMAGCGVNKSEDRNKCRKYVGNHCSERFRYN